MAHPSAPFLVRVGLTQEIFMHFPLLALILENELRKISSPFFKNRLFI
jgi:hypothetical protein